MKKTFMKFLETNSPTGQEKEARDFLKKNYDSFLNFNEDFVGNLYGEFKSQKGSPSQDKTIIMITGHLDEIGFQIVSCSDEGMLYFRESGGLDNRALLGSPVVILTERGAVNGVIGHQTIHYLEEEDLNKTPKQEALWIDIGAKNKKEAQKLVSVGDYGCLKPNCFANGETVFSKGIDDKVGAFIAFEVLKKIKEENKINRMNKIVAVGTAQEECGGRGALIASNNIKPTLAINIDVDFSTDIPSVKKEVLGEISLGKGPVLIKNNDVDMTLFSKIKKIAVDKKIPFQISAGLYCNGGTDASDIRIANLGIPVINIGIPNRYMHTPTEAISFADVENCINLIAEFVTKDF